MQPHYPALREKRSAAAIFMTFRQNLNHQKEVSQ